MDARRPRVGLRPHLAQPQRTDLALLNQARHRAVGVFDRHVRIHPVQVEHINHVGAQAAQARVAGSLHPFGPGIQAALVRAFAKQIAKLGAENQLISLGRYDLAHQLFVGPIRVEIRGIDPPSVVVQVVGKRLPGLAFGGGAVVAGHGHGAQDKRGGCVCQHTIRHIDFQLMPG
ncbi:hypothetical protein D3C71_1557430 [compost metagenome]